MSRNRASTGTRLALLACACAVILAPVTGAEAAQSHLNLSYDIDSPTAGSANLLDLYAPDGVTARDSRPVVVHVHGGGWRRGDKGNSIENKVDLFTGAGYLFVSVNYRLSPVGGDPANPDPARVRFPAHPHDVGEAIGWLDRHVDEYGGDPGRMLLMGHSAGAHLASLVATDPRFVESYGVDPWQLIGAVSLDTDAFDIAAEATQTQNTANRDLIWNAFGTPAENAASGSWAAGSPIRWASPKDPELLLVTSANPNRLADNRNMATALEQDPEAVFIAPYDHEGINDAVGSPSDTSGETQAIMAFVSRSIAAAVAPKTRFKHRPPSIVRTRKPSAAARFAFSSKSRDSTFECRLDGAGFRRCSSPRTVEARPGPHTFRVRAVTDRGRPGEPKRFRFRVVRVG